MSAWIPQMGDRVQHSYYVVAGTVVGVNGHWFWVEWDDRRHGSYDNTYGFSKVEVKP